MEQENKEMQQTIIYLENLCQTLTAQTASARQDAEIQTQVREVMFRELKGEIKDFQEENEELKTRLDYYVEELKDKIEENKKLKDKIEELCYGCNEERTNEMNSAHWVREVKMVSRYTNDHPYIHTPSVQTQSSSSSERPHASSRRSAISIRL